MPSYTRHYLISEQAWAADLSGLFSSSQLRQIANELDNVETESMQISTYFRFVRARLENQEGDNSQLRAAIRSVRRWANNKMLVSELVLRLDTASFVASIGQLGPYRATLLLDYIKKDLHLENMREDA